MTKPYFLNQPTTVKKVRATVKYTNELFGTDLTINTLEETYWVVSILSMNKKKHYFRGWSQAEENSDDTFPIWASIKNDSRIILFRSEQQAEMYIKSISPFAMVEKYKEVK